MVDLSRVLGDVYSHSDEVAALRPVLTQPSPAQAEPEEWADEARLDEAFRRWRPGPPREAPAAERMFAAPALALPQQEADAPSHAYVPGTPAAAFAALDDPLEDGDHGGAPSDVDGDALSEAVADAFTKAVAAEMSGRPRWCREHDDILPPRSGGRRGRRFGRR